jgi:histidinol-phosphate aminotransferase
MKPQGNTAPTAPIGPAPIRPLAPSYRRRAIPDYVDLRLDGNEGPQADEQIARSMAAIAPDAARSYPDATSLERLLAARHGVAPEQVVITAGADEALDRVFRAYGGPGRKAVLPAPTFEMIPRYAALASCEVDLVPWLDGPFPSETFLARTPVDDTAILCVVSPNNPTGLVASADAVLQLSAARPNSLVVLDQAYAEYAEEDLTSACLGPANVLVLRTLSKAQGLAGLRVGYAVGPRTCIETLRAAAGPYPVAGPSLALATSILQDDLDRVAPHVDRVRRERGTLRDVLREHGFEVPTSHANFVYVRGERTAWLADALTSLGVLVRRFTENGGTQLRITCPGDDERIARLVAAVNAAMSPPAILFDIDGVLADVSQSYRIAILETARSFGVEVSAAEIRQLKSEGHANNDWDLTRRAMARRGTEIDLASVIARFERIYQGTPTEPGLRETETNCVDPRVFRDLAASVPVGVVTGRPRADAERFLRRHGLRDACRALVCMEDGPLKPDPAPVRTALRQLGVPTAWFLGDTPDDMTAARAAGVVPIGVIAPGDPEDEARTSLDRAGAACVLRSLDSLPDDRSRLFLLLDNR